MAGQLNEVDKKDLLSLPACAEYAKDIFTYLRAREGIVKCNEGFLKNQTSINSVHREKIIEWLVEMQMKFHLHDETLYLAVNILDRFLERKKFDRYRLPLLGLTAILTAAKYEEIYPPHFKSFHPHLKREYSFKEFSEMELLVLRTLNFDISIPSVPLFLKRYRKFINSDTTRLNLSLYICEGQLLTETMGKYEPSLLAISGLYLAEKAINNDFSLDESLLNEAKHSEEEIKACAKVMLENMLAKERIMLSNIRRKYGKYKEVVKIALNSIIVK